MNIAYQNLNIMCRHWENTGVIWGIDRGFVSLVTMAKRFDIPTVTDGVPSAYACLELTLGKIVIGCGFGRCVKHR